MLIVIEVVVHGEGGGWLKDSNYTHQHNFNNCKHSAMVKAA